MRRMNSILTLTLLGVLVLATCASSASATSEWTMDISSVMAGATPVTANLTYGVSSTATDGFDAGVDADAPPADPSGFDTYFNEPGASTEKLNVNIKSVGDPRTWTLLVVAPSGKTVNVSWTLANIPSDVDMQIQELDLTTGELTGSSIDMKAQDKVTVTGGAFAATTKGYRITATASAADPGTGWTMDLSSVMAGATPVTADLTYGVSSTATDGFDAGVDADAPPADPSGFDTYFNEPGASTEKLNVNIKSVGDPRTWTLLVVAPSGKTVNVSWTLANIPSDVDMQIQELDLTTGELTGSSIDMKAQDKVTVTGGAFAATTQGYRITATTSAAAEVHDVYVKPDYTGAYDTGIRIDNATVQKIPLDQNLMIGEPYFIRYSVVNNGTAGSEDVNITVKVSNATWSSEIENYPVSVNSYHYGNVTWDTTGLTPGDYTVLVNATIAGFADANPADNEVTRAVTVTEAGAAANQPPTAVIASPTASGTYHEGTEVSFLSTGSTDPDGTIEAYTWDFGDGSTGTGVSTTRTYTTNGSMTVTLTVTDDGGANDTETVTINVYPTGAVIVHLYTGWNLIAIPVNDPTADTAAELASKITGCKEVVKWDASTQTYDPYTRIAGDWTGTDFAITGGTGLFVNMEGATTVGFTGGAWS